MLTGIDPSKSLPYTLRRDDPLNPTIFWLRPQGVVRGNKHLVGYQDAHTKKTRDSVAAKTTLEDLAQFLSTVERVENFCFLGEAAPTPVIETQEDLKKVFYQLDIANFNELMNASRDIFELTEGEKNALGSSSGQGSDTKRAAGSVTAASSAMSTEGGPAGNA